MAYYYKSMHRHSFNGLLMRPSFLSSVVCSLLAIAVPVGVNWSYVLKNYLFYDYFFGTNGLIAIVRDNTTNTPVVADTLTNKAFQHNISILFGAIVAAVGLWVAVWLIMHIMGSISFTIKEISAVETPAKHAVEREMVERTSIRLLVAAIWIFYIFISVKIILPFCVLASQLGLDGRTKIAEGIGYILFAGATVFFAAHLHIVLARLLLLRPRVFGGEEVILSE